MAENENDTNVALLAGGGLLLAGGAFLLLHKKPSGLCPKPGAYVQSKTTGQRWYVDAAGKHAVSAAAAAACTDIPAAVDDSALAGCPTGAPLTALTGCTPIATTPPPTITGLPVLPPRPGWWGSASHETKIASQVHVDLLGRWPSQTDAFGIWTTIFTQCPGVSLNCGGQAGVKAVAFEIIAAPSREYDQYAQHYIPANTIPEQYPSAWTEAFYATALGRWAAPAEVLAWVGIWSAAGREAAAMGITSSGEFTVRVTAQANA